MYVDDSMRGVESKTNMPRHENTGPFSIFVGHRCWEQMVRKDRRYDWMWMTHKVCRPLLVGCYTRHRTSVPGPLLLTACIRICLQK